MRVLALLLLPLVFASGCTSKTPAVLAEEAVRALYTVQLGDRERERDALRKNGSEKLIATMAALDASCREILANDTPNHGLPGDAVLDFNRNCLDGLPLSCGARGAGAALLAVKPGVLAGDSITATATVSASEGAAVAVEVTLRVVDGNLKVDEVRCN